MGGEGTAFRSEVIETGGRSTRAFGMIERALTEARVEREEIECIAVGLGPGSYTGIRAAISVAQGWQLARNTRLLGINTVDCLVEQVVKERITGKVNIVIDAQRGEFYCASWLIAQNKREEIEPLAIVSRAEIEGRIKNGEQVIGPDLKRAFPAAKELYPSAMALGKVALNRNDFAPGEQLKPVYLRETSFVKAPPPRQM